MERHPVADPQLGGTGAQPRLCVTAPVDLQGHGERRPGAAEAGDRLDRNVQLVGRGERAGVDEPERAIGAEGAPWVRRRVEPGERRAVEQDRDLVGGNADRDEPSGKGIVDRDRSAGHADGQALLEDEQTMDERVRDAREAHPEELRHRLVEVDHERHPDEPERQPGEDEEVRQRVDLDERVAPPAVGPGHGPAGPEQEGQVLAQVRAQPGALVTLDVEPMDVDPVDDGIRCVAGRRSAKTSTGRPRATSDSASPPDARVLLVVGMDDHAHGPALGSGRAGGHDRTC